MVTMQRTGLAALGLVIAGAGCELVAGVRSDVGPYPAGSGGTGGTGGGVTTGCADGKKDGDETGKDCGGSCSACPDGEGCKSGGDCKSKSCSAGGTCAAPTCDDKVRNGDETDVDCGGKTCGPCAFGKGCAAGSDCVTGFCNGATCDAQTIVAGLTNPNSLAADSKNVYWADADDGTVMMADTAVGTPMVVVMGLQDPQRLVGAGGDLTDANPSALNWVEPTGGQVGNASVSLQFGPYVGAPVTGVNPRAVTPGGLYWTNQAPSGGVPQGSIMTHDLANPASGYKWIALGGQPDRLAFAGTSGNLIFTMNVYGDHGLWIVAGVSTATPVVLVPNVEPAGLAADDTFAYWADGATSGSVAKVSLAGGTPTVVASGQPGPTDVAIDTLYIYWLTQGKSPGAGAVMKAPLAGGPPTTLASGQEAPRGLLLFKSDVYWVTGAMGQGAVKRVPR